MEKRFMQQRSKVPDSDSHRQRCMPSFHFLHINQLLHIRRMLPYGRHGDKRIKAAKTKHDVSSPRKEPEYMDKDADFVVEEEANVSTKSSSRELIRALNSKGKSREKDEKRSLSPSSSSRLMRTYSIHHLENIDDAENTPTTENPTAEHNTHASGSSANDEHIPLLAIGSDDLTFQKPSEMCETSNAIDYASKTQLDGLSDHLIEKQSLLRKKLNEAKDALSKQKGIDDKEQGGDAVFHQSKEFLDMMQLLNANREIFLKILQDPSIIANYLQSQQNSTAERVLGKSGPMLVTGLSARKSNTDFEAGTSSSNSSIEENGAQAMESMARDEIHMKQEPSTINNTRLGPSFDNISNACVAKDQRINQRDVKKSSNGFKVIKRRIKDVIEENRKEGHRISMDGVLHKIPYGRKPSNDVKKGKQYPWESPSSARYDRDSSRSIKRSHSLTESLDKYSHLIESVSSRKFKRLPERSKQEDGGQSQGIGSSKTFGRICSLPNFEACSTSKNVQYEALAAQSLKIPVAADISDFNELKTVGPIVHKEESLEGDSCASNTLELDVTVTEYQERPVPSNDQGICEAYDVSQNITEENNIHIPLNEQETRDMAYHSGEPDKSPISIPDWSSSEDLANLAEFGFSEAFELEHRHMHFEGLDLLTNEQSHLDVDVSDRFEGREADHELLRVPSLLDDFSYSHVQVDQRDEAEFNYVRDILWRSGFGGDEFLGAWYSADQPVDPLLFEEALCAPDAATAKDEPEMTLYHQLLFDLINEILMEIYDTYYACCPWLSGFDSHIRPMPLGHHVLKEVWGNISWLRDYQLQVDATLDHVVARDFAKNDGWMDLQYDCEFVGLQLEDLILDDLLDEAILQLID